MTNISRFSTLLCTSALVASCATTGKVGAEGKLAAAPAAVEDKVAPAPAAAPAAAPTELVFKLGRTPDGTTTFTELVPAEARVMHQEVRGNEFVADFQVPGRDSLVTWRMRLGEFLNRRFKGETIRVELK